MSLKLIIILPILTLCAFVVIQEARVGRDRGGSLAEQAANEKFARRRSRLRKIHHKSTGSHSSRSYKSQKHDTAHESHNSHTISQHNTHSKSNRRKKQKQETQHVNHNRHTTFDEPYQRNTHNWHPLGSSTSQHRPNTVSSDISHNWGGHQLPPDHVYVTQPSSIPVNAVYYAHPPTQTHTEDSTDFALGYLVGRSLTRNRHHHHHHYEQQPQAVANNQTQTANVTVEKQMNAVVVRPTEQAHYWPTDAEVSLAPLNNTLIPDGVTSPEPIFKNPPIVSAQKLNAENATFELPTATAPPPATPLTNGIICMPWSFNEADPSKPENVVVVQKTICFPAPPAPPTPPTTPLAPIAGDIDIDLPTTTTTAA